MRLGALAALIGAGAGLAQAPFGIVLLLPAALVWALRAASNTAPRSAAWLGWAMGAGYFGLTLSWIVEPLLVDAAQYGWMAPPALILMAGGMALFWAAGFWVGRRVGGSFAIALAWAGAEALRAHILTGFPWADFAQGLMDTPAAFALPWLGPRGLALALLGAGALISLSRARWILAGVLGAALQLLPGPGPGPLETPAAPVVRLIQPNAPQHQKWDPAYSFGFFQRLLAYTQSATGVQAIIWPEMALTYGLDSSGDLLQMMDEAAQGTPVIFGAPRRHGQGYANSAILMTQGAQIAQIYDKRHLVPFGEYMPFSDLFARVGIYGLAARAGYVAGQSPPDLDVPGVGRLRILICYEGIFAEEVRQGPRPDALLMITNDAWFGRRVGPYQHLMQARMRALELGLPMLRVANTGVSAVIDARGMVVSQLALGEEGALDAALPGILPPTPYARWGEAIFLLLWAMGVAALGTRLVISR